jgi:hypothetical protein
MAALSNFTFIGVEHVLGLPQNRLLKKRKTQESPVPVVHPEGKEEQEKMEKMKNCTRWREQTF